MRGPHLQRAMTTSNPTPPPSGGASPERFRPLRIALLGSRGVPARYGGYETFMEELGRRLARRGHRVTVYCRSHYTHRSEHPDGEFLGMRLVVLPTIRTKHLDTPIHTLLSALHGTTRSYDAALVVNAANAVFVPLLRLSGTPTALHVDGLEQERSKWGFLGRMVYRFSERLATWVPTRLVTDAATIEQHFLDRHGTASTMIPYGGDLPFTESRETLERLALSPGSYYLYVSRFEPENNPHRVVEAFRQSRSTRRLVMLGDAPYSGEFIRRLRDNGDERILFPGAIYGTGYRELLQHAHAFVQATEVGGTHPALVEAMSFGNCILLNDVPENREVAGDDALYFRAQEPATLTALFDQVDDDPDHVAAMARRAQRRAAARYTWEAVTDRYQALFEELAAR